MGNDRDSWIQEIDALLKNWCQGDYVVGEHWFVQRCNPNRPLTEISEDAAHEGVDLAEEEVPGLVVVSQTCDIVRSCRDRPFIEVVPLVEVNQQQLSEIQKSRRPQYAYIPGASQLNLVADLDRVMTMEKAVIAEWERQAGCSSDEEIRLLGQALARKRVRFAFPDDFNEFAKNLQKRMKQKHNKSSDEGEALRALREIRVRASPAWNSSQVELMFWFIRNEQETEFQGIGWDQLLEKWLKLIPESGRFHKVNGSVLALEDITAKDYVESDVIDLDHLSS